MGLESLVVQVPPRGYRALVEHPDFYFAHFAGWLARNLVRAKAVPARLPGSSLSIAEAAAFLGVSVTTFDDVIRPELPLIRVGRRVTFSERDLIQWRERQKAGSSNSPLAGRSMSFVSATTEDATCEAQVAQTLAWLRRKRRKSTHR
jgi:excisionase family DNA binding protein